jgi:serine/threonine-protein kinase HipA
VVLDRLDAKGGGLPRNCALKLLSDMPDGLGPALERTKLDLGDQVPGSVSDPIITDSLQRADQTRKVL